MGFAKMFSHQAQQQAEWRTCHELASVVEESGVDEQQAQAPARCVAEAVRGALPPPSQHSEESCMIGHGAFCNWSGPI